MDYGVCVLSGLGIENTSDKMTRMLCIDASTEACSVALLNGAEMTERYELAPRQHAKLLLPMINELLSQSGLVLTQLDAIACHVGPGAFTGIRIAVSVAQALAYGSNLPTIALSSLANLAQQGVDTDESADYWCAIDARMQEVYFAAYRMNEDKSLALVSEEQVIAPAKINLVELSESSINDHFVLLGSGWEAYKEVFLFQKNANFSCIPNRFPRASAGIKMAKAYFDAGKILTPEALLPAYLRNNVAVKKANK